MIKRIIARLDIKNDTLVKGINMEGLRNLGEPRYFSERYFEEGIDEIHYQDVVASLYSRNMLLNIIKETTKKSFVILSIGGGIRSDKDIFEALRSGADKVSLNSFAVRKPIILNQVKDLFGSSTISVNIDAIFDNGDYYVLIDSGRERTNIKVFDWVDKVQNFGCGEIIITSIRNEGKMNGFDLKLCRKVKQLSSVPVVAHGGGGSCDQIVELFKETDVDAVSLASLLHYSYLDSSNKLNNEGRNVFLNNFILNQKEKVTINQIKKSLNKNNISVRL